MKRIYLALILLLTLTGLTISFGAMVPAYAASGDMPPMVQDESEIPMSNPADEARAANIGKHLRCVVCQSESINDSQADMARDMRNMIREKISYGWSDHDIIEFMRQHYGDFILLKPRFEAKTFFLWSCPILFLCLAIWGIVLFFRRHEPGAAWPVLRQTTHSTGKTLYASTRSSWLVMKRKLKAMIPPPAAPKPKPPQPPRYLPPAPPVRTAPAATVTASATPSAAPKKKRAPTKTAIKTALQDPNAPVAPKAAPKPARRKTTKPKTAAAATQVQPQPTNPATPPEAPSEPPVNLPPVTEPPSTPVPQTEPPAESPKRKKTRTRPRKPKAAPAAETAPTVEAETRIEPAPVQPRVEEPTELASPEPPPAAESGPTQTPTAPLETSESSNQEPKN